MATTEERRLRTEFDYIVRHWDAWMRKVAPLAGQIAHIVRQLEWQGTGRYQTRTVVPSHPHGGLIPWIVEGLNLTEPVMSIHQRTIAFVRDRADEAVEAQYHIAQALAEIAAHMEDVPK